MRAVALLLISLCLSQVPLNAWAVNENFFSQKVFQSLCSTVAQPLKTGWVFDRPQFELTETALYFTQVKNADSFPEYTVNVSADGLTSRELETFPNQIRDLHATDGKVWLLFDSELMAIDASTGKRLTSIRTFDGSMKSPEHDRANEFAVVGSRAYVAHGTFGVNVFDLNTGSLVEHYDLQLRQRNHQQSKAVGVTTDGRSLFVMVDAVSEPTASAHAFNGIIQVPLERPSAFTKYDIENRTSGKITPNITTSIVNGMIYMNNRGNMQSLTVADLEASKGSAFSAPFKRILFPFENKDYSVEFMGDVLISNDQFYGCGKISPDSPPRKGVVIHGAY